MACQASHGTLEQRKESPNEVEVQGNISESENVCSIVSKVYSSFRGSREEMAGSVESLLTNKARQGQLLGILGFQYI
jgi:hypothetical protein